MGVLHGPNLDLLGDREPELYGTVTLRGIDQRLAELGTSLGVALETYQSNHEGALIDRVHAWADTVDGLVVNAGAYTHTSIALRDALAGVGRPFVEVHLTNVHAREAFRHVSLLASEAVGVVTGLGVESYLSGLRGLVTWLREEN